MKDLILFISSIILYLHMTHGLCYIIALCHTSGATASLIALCAFFVASLGTCMSPCMSHLICNNKKIKKKNRVTPFFFFIFIKLQDLQHKRKTDTRLGNNRRASGGRMTFQNRPLCHIKVARAS